MLQHHSDMTGTRPHANWLFLSALAASVAYCLWGQHDVATAPYVAWKAACVAVFAIWAAINARSADGWIIVVVLALGAIGDAVIEWNQTAGAVPFLAGHLVGAILYLRNRRHRPSATQTALAVALLVGIPSIAFLLTHAVGVTIYATGLGLMAASAWASRFPRYRVGIGAVLFAASDLLIFARMGPLHDSTLPGRLIMPLYFAGQALIAWGVVTTLRKWQADDELRHRL
jgi:uncharacterized membrane protein YhhN